MPSANPDTVGRFMLACLALTTLDFRAFAQQCAGAPSASACATAGGKMVV